MSLLSNAIDATLLSKTASLEDYKKLISDAGELACRAVCIPPFVVSDIFDHYLSVCDSVNSDLSLCTVLSFPTGWDGSDRITGVIYQLLDKVDDFDLVLNHYIVFGDGRGLDRYLAFLSYFNTICHGYGVVTKFIIETPALTREQIQKAVEITIDSGFDFIKTATGFYGATTCDDVSYLKQVVGSSLFIKSSGGIKTYQDAISHINAGADVIGTSSFREIIDGSY